VTDRPDRPERPARPPRSETREVVELKQIKEQHPELAAAVDMQLELVEVQRRVQGRVPLPWIQPDPEWLIAQQREGRPAVRFGDIPLDWSDFRLSLRQTAGILHRHDALDREDYEKIVALGREGHALEPLAAAWYTETSGVNGHQGEGWPVEGTPAGLDQVLLLASRPFLIRCAEALMPRAEFVAWRHSRCPVCGWEAEFAAITPSAERRLICGRCSAQWAFDATDCPYCENRDRTRITSFATRDGKYRVYACDVCKRYLKAYDGRHATRPVMVVADSIATLPLDAAAMQRGSTA
jgi:hypothetical protein